MFQNLLRSVNTPEQLIAADRTLLWILLAHIPFVAILLPLSNGTWVFCIVVSLMIGALSVANYWLFRGQRIAGLLNSVLVILWSVAIIQAKGGIIEYHFHIFAAIALTIVYKDGLAVITAALAVAIHHALFTVLQASDASLFGEPIIVFKDGAYWQTFFVHAGFVVFEAIILVALAMNMAADRSRSNNIMHLIREFDANNDLTQRLTSTRTENAKAFNTMLDKFESIIVLFADLTVELRNGSTKLQEVSKHTQDISERQKVTMTEAAEAIDHISSAVTEVSNSAADAAELARGAVATSEKGRANAEQSMARSTATAKSLTSASTQVQELVKRVNHIHQFLASITTISDQTNLLALNAAIEAARAGDAGRGFAVVADEVRSLSRRTQEFTEQIRTTISELSESSQETLRAIEDGRTASESSVLAMQQSQQMIAEVNDALATMMGMNDEIAASVTQQAAAAVQVNNSIKEVVGDARKGLSASAQTMEASADLGYVVDQLKREICQFQVNGESLNLCQASFDASSASLAAESDESTDVTLF